MTEDDRCLTDRRYTGSDGENRNMEEKSTDFEKELLNRLEQMEEDSRNIKGMSKKDYVIAAIVVVVCLVAVVAGA